MTDLQQADPVAIAATTSRADGQLNFDEIRREYIDAKAALVPIAEALDAIRPKVEAAKAELAAAVERQTQADFVHASVLAMMSRFRDMNETCTALQSAEDCIEFNELVAVYLEIDAALILARQLVETRTKIQMLVQTAIDEKRRLGKMLEIEEDCLGIDFEKSGASIIDLSGFLHIAASQRQAAVAKVDILRRALSKLEREPFDLSGSPAAISL